MLEADDERARILALETKRLNVQNKLIENTVEKLKMITSLYFDLPFPNNVGNEDASKIVHANNQELEDALDLQTFRVTTFCQQILNSFKNPNNLRTYPSNKEKLYPALIGVMIKDNMPPLFVSLWQDQKIDSEARTISYMRLLIPTTSQKGRTGKTNYILANFYIPTIFFPDKMGLSITEVDIDNNYSYIDAAYYLNYDAYNNNCPTYDWASDHTNPPLRIKQKFDKAILIGKNIITYEPDSYLLNDNIIASNISSMMSYQPIK